MYKRRFTTFSSLLSAHDCLPFHTLKMHKSTIQNHSVRAASSILRPAVDVACAFATAVAEPPKLVASLFAVAVACEVFPPTAHKPQR